MFFRNDLKLQTEFIDTSEPVLIISRRKEWTIAGAFLKDHRTADFISISVS